MNTRNAYGHQMSMSDPRPLRVSDPRLQVAIPARTVDSNSLFRGEHEIGIEHQGALYRLKITRQGKLILNK